MTLVSQTILLRVLLLEDEDSLRTDLAALLASNLPGSDIVEAGTIAEALQFLSEQSGFNLGILDCRIPLRRGMQPKANPQVAECLREMQIPSLFITSFRESDDVQAFLSNRSLVDPPVAIIEKNLEPGILIGDLVRHVREWFTRQASQQVIECVNSLFGPAVLTGGLRSGTAALIEAQQEIAANWPYLDEVARDLVRRWFVVNEVSHDFVILSLFSADDSE